MMNMNEKRVLYVGAALVLGVFGALLIAGTASATQSGDAYGGSGDWIINNPTTVADENLDVSGNIEINNGGSLTVTNTIVRFTIADRSILVHSGASIMISDGAGGTTSISPLSATGYWKFIVESGALGADVQNVTLNRVDGGVTVNGGSAATHFFAYVTVNNARGNGFTLVNSDATLFNVRVIGVEPILTKSATVETTLVQQITISGQYTYTYNYTYRYTNQTIFSQGVGVSTQGGSPWIDGVAVEMVNATYRVDALLKGNFTGVFDYRGQNQFWYAFNYEYNYEYSRAGLAMYGFKGVNSSFAHLSGVAPVIDNVRAEIHGNLQTCTCYTYLYPPPSSNSYQVYNYSGYNYNFLKLSSLIVGVYIENAGLSTISGLDLLLGSTTSVFYNDWIPSIPFYGQYWNSYITQAPPEVFGLFSVETVTVFTAQAVTPVNAIVRDSILRKAGVRVDRTFNYLAGPAANGTNDTVFRGTVLIDNVTVIDSPSFGVTINVKTETSMVIGGVPYGGTYMNVDVAVAVLNSSFTGARAFSLSILNKPSVSTNYQATFAIVGNTFLNGSVASGSNFDAIIVLNTGGHLPQLAGDTYKVDARIAGNQFTSMKGPLVGLDYSDYKFGGGSSLLLENNRFENVTNFNTALSDAFLKTTVDTVTMRGNTFLHYKFVYGVLGGIWGSDTYYYWSYKFMYPTYCSMYKGSEMYYCVASWPYKTPNIVVEGNTFEDIRQMTGSTYSVGWIVPAGRGHVIFRDNVVNNSNALFVNPYLIYYSYYKWPVEDVTTLVENNTISNQTTNAFVRYIDPYKSGQNLDVYRNTYRDSSVRFIDWKPAISSIQPTNYKATMHFERNTVFNVTGDAVHLTGLSTVSNNTWTGVSGWALIVDYMAQVPDIASNTIRATGNGYQFAPVVMSGITTTSIFEDLVIDVTNTAIQMIKGNMLIFRTDFGNARTAVSVKDGYAEIYSSHIAMLSALPQGSAYVEVFNEIGYVLHWANAEGVDSNVPVDDGLVVTFTADNRYVAGRHSNAAGVIPTATTSIWKMYSFGTATVSDVYVPFNVLATKSGITSTFQMPQLGPGETLTFFNDHPLEPILLVDNAVPTVSIGSPLEGRTVGSSTVNIIGYTVERGSGLAVQHVRVDGGVWINIPFDQSTWTVPVSGLIEGLHTIEVEAIDVAGNTATTTVSFVVDVTPPSLTLTSPLEASILTNEPVFDIRGHVEPSGSTVTVNGVKLFPNSRGDFTYNYTLSDGLNILRFKSWDTAGNMVTVVRTITFDRFAPFLQVDAPVNGILTNVVHVDVLGRTERDARVTVNGLPAFVNPIDGTFSLQQVDLDSLFDQTENLLVIRAVDLAGNVKYENRTVTVDVKAPSIDLELPADVRGKIEAGLPVPTTTLDVRGTTDSSDAKISIGGQPVALQGRAFVRLMVLREGVNVIAITSDDLAGNHRELTLRVVRDTVKPVLVLESPSEPTLLTNQTTLLVTGYTDTADSVVTVVYTDSRGVHVAEPVLVVGVGEPQQYRFEYTLVLNTDGNEHVVDVFAADLAGNTDEKSFTYTAKVGKPFLEIVGFKPKVTETFIWINGTAEVGIDKVMINGQEFPIVDQFFAVRWNLPIQSGNYTFTVTVRDAAGNTNTYANRTEVQASITPVVNHKETPFYSDTTFQIAAGTGLLGVAMTALVLALSRRRETD